MSESKFKDGVIAWSPRSGFEVIRIYNTKQKYPLIHGERSYCRDGIYCDTDKYPSIFTLEEAAKLGYEMTKDEKRRFGLLKTRTVDVERWVNIYHGDQVSGAHHSQKAADMHADSNRIACIKLKGTYEEEVEE